MYCRRRLRIPHRPTPVNHVVDRLLGRRIVVPVSCIHDLDQMRGLLPMREVDKPHFHNRYHQIHAREAQTNVRKQDPESYIILVILILRAIIVLIIVIILVVLGIEDMFIGLRIIVRFLRLGLRLGNFLRLWLGCFIYQIQVSVHKVTQQHLLQEWSTGVGKFDM